MPNDNKTVGEAQLNFPEAEQLNPEIEQFNHETEFFNPKTSRVAPPTACRAICSVDLSMANGPVGHGQVSSHRVGCLAWWQFSEATAVADRRGRIGMKPWQICLQFASKMLCGRQCIGTQIVISS